MDVRSVFRWSGRCVSGLLLGVAVGIVSAADPPVLSPASPVPAPPAVMGLPDLTGLALARHPQLARAGLAIDAAAGRALQAGLYPNPTVSVTLDELGDRTGPGGVNTLPLVSQEIVTGGKLKLDRAAALKEVDQATLALTEQRYTLLAGVRQAYFDFLALNRRVTLLTEMEALARQTVELTQRLVTARQAAPLDRVQLEVEQLRIAVELESARKELPAAYQRLAAATGVINLPPSPVADVLDLPLPPYDLDRTKQLVLANHPEVHAARVGVEKAQFELRRAQVQAFPNVTVGAGYVRQNQNRSDDWTIGASLPVPVWNRNQGNIRASVAHLQSAQQNIGRVEIDLTDRLASAFRDYSSAKQRAAQWVQVRQKAQEAYGILANAPTASGLQRLEAQRALTQANVEYVRALGEAWKAASVISGLTLEEAWPPCDDKILIPVK